MERKPNTLMILQKFVLILLGEMSRHTQIRHIAVVVYVKHPQQGGAADMAVEVENSILNSVKKLLGIQPEDISFDVDIMMYINSAIFTLYQLGVVESIYTVTSSENTYNDMFGLPNEEPPVEEPVEPEPELPPVVEEILKKNKSEEEIEEPIAPKEPPKIIKELPAIKMYLYYKTRLLFDPPSNGSVLETLKQQISELEWRLNVSVDPPETFEKRGEEDDTTGF